ncbi:MAG TPA: hypothetical protein VF149_03115 [Bacillales bacterium]
MYLIKGVNVPNGDRKDFLIRERKIAYVSDKLDRLKHKGLNCQGFSIRPGKVAVDFSILHAEDPSMFKKKMIEWQRSGFTTLLVVCSVESERKLKQTLKLARHQMINSSIDYVVGISFPMRKLTPSLVRMCRREKVPFIFASMDSKKDMEGATWSWIRDALFSYPLTIVPDWQGLSLSKKRLLKLKNVWREFAGKNDIPTTTEFPEDGGILPKKILRKIGISPLKGEIHTGCDLDYNLFENASLADGNQLHYDGESIPDIVVLRGKLMKAGQTIYYRPGFGKEISVRVPGYLTNWN